MLAKYRASFMVATLPRLRFVLVIAIEVTLLFFPNKVKI
jgi:hypothetical protein